MQQPNSTNAIVKMSDVELRRELIKLGASVGPITSTTRVVYTKRLEKLRKENAAQAAVKQRRALLDEKGSQSSSASKLSLKRLRPSFSTDESGEDSLAEENASRIRTRANLRNSSYRTSREAETKPQKKKDNARENVLINSHSSTPLTTRSTRLAYNQPNTFNPQTYSDESDGECNKSDLTDINKRSRLKKNSCEEKENLDSSQMLRRRGMHGQPSPRTTHEQIRRDSRKSGVKILGNGISGGLRKSEHDNVGQEGNTALTDSQVGTVIKQQPWTLNFSSFLPIGTCIFFVIVGLLYITMKYDSSLNSSGPFQLEYDSAENKKNSTIEILHVANLVYDHIGTYAGLRECSNPPVIEHLLTITEIIEDIPIENGLQNKTFRGAMQKFLEMPDWGISLFNKEMEPLLNLEKLHGSSFIETKQPLLSGWCRFTRAVKKVLLRILFTTAVGILLWIALLYRRYRIEKQREEREQMYIMVQKILDVLRKQYESSERSDKAKPFLPMLHVRDMIIPPQDREKMDKIWKRATQFLSESETRIRVENQRIQGEDYLVWRWIQVTSPSKRHTPTSRIWQGEAFDISKSINRPMICPTPCLKIRHMFDPDMEVRKNWVEQIQDSILEKCHGNNEILRINVEKESKEGLVYMLCTSNKAAGRAFQALHGAWFDGRLVTVKFIRLQRFYQRFPDARDHSDIPMQPTSAVPVSTCIAPPSTGNDTPYESIYPTLPSE